MEEMDNYACLIKYATPPFTRVSMTRPPHGSRLITTVGAAVWTMGERTYVSRWNRRNSCQLRLHGYSPRSRANGMRPSSSSRLNCDYNRMTWANMRSRINKKKGIIVHNAIGINHSTRSRKRKCTLTHHGRESTWVAAKYEKISLKNRESRLNYNYTATFSVSVRSCSDNGLQ